MTRFNPKSAIFAGIIATVAMTMMTIVAPMMGMPKMNIPGMLSGFMGTGILVGWMAHFMIGLMFAFSYSAVFYNRVGAPAVLHGALFSLIPWLMAQLIVMPIMGMGLFSGSLIMAMGSLMGHLVYGVVLGALYRPLTIGAVECDEPRVVARGSAVN